MMAILATVGFIIGFIFAVLLMVLAALKLAEWVLGKLVEWRGRAVKTEERI
jgi:hypothetical protein